MDKETILILAVGALLMILPITLVMKFYNEKLYKALPIALLITVVGTVGACLWFSFEVFLKSGEFIWGGTSFYGAVFGIPIVFIPVAKLFNIRYAYLMDYCAPAGGAILIAMKYRCIMSGCCEGRVIRVMEDGTQILFPSQIVELLIGAVLCIVLVCLAMNQKNKGVLYPFYLVLYGGTRFIMNFFRGNLSGLIFFIPAGHFWSICSIIIGVFFLYKHFKVKNSFNIETT